MVNRLADRRDTPVYDLDRVRELAGKGLVTFAGKKKEAGTKVEQNAEDLGYSPDDVFACIASLQPGEFDESLLYPDEKFWQDVYKCRRTAPGGEVDDLYIKLKLTRNAVTVVLQSFHRERYSQ